MIFSTDFYKTAEAFRWASAVSISILIYQLVLGIGVYPLVRWIEAFIHLLQIESLAAPFPFPKSTCTGFRRLGTSCLYRADTYT